MYVPEFSIPLKREDLLEATEDQYFVRHLFSARELNERLESARTALLEEGPVFVVDHFPTFYSFFQQFKHATELNCQKAWNIMCKALMENKAKLHIVLDDMKNTECDVKNDHRNLLKMTCYILFELMGLFQEKYTDHTNILVDSKGKKKQKPSDDNWDWIEENQKMLNEIHSFLQLPIKLLWDPPIVDDEFINLVANYCYKCLEDPNISNPKKKCIRETIFQVLGVLIKNYLHGLSFCVKIVQLLKSYDHLVGQLAKGTVQLIKEYNCTNIVKEIIREITETDGDQLAADASGTRALNQYLVQLAESVPETIVPAVDLLVQHLAGDSYSMRMCVLEVLGEIVTTILSRENLSEELKKMRDEFLDSLQDHIHDTNAFVRSKVLQIWQKLCTLNAIPISRFNQLLELIVGRLNDKSANVKKQAIHLVRDLLERNPYSSQLNSLEIQNQLEEEMAKLEKLKKEYALNVGDTSAQWKLLEPKLEQLLEGISEDEQDEEDDDDDDDDEEEEGGGGGGGSNVNCSESRNSENLDDVNVEERIEDIGKFLIAGDCETAVKELLKLKKKCYAILDLDKDDVPLIILLENIFQQKMKGNLIHVPVEVQDQINKYRTTVEYLENSLKFAKLIDLALPIILSLLDSNVVSDVLESNQFFTAAYLFGFNEALEGVRRMLYLMYSKEDVIKTAISESYKNLYFAKNVQGRQQSISTVKNLSDLILKLNVSQLRALEYIVRQWLQSGLIDNNSVQVMFERFSRKISNTTEAYSWASLVLLGMVGSEEPRIIKSNISVLLSQGLCNSEKQRFLISKETCAALQRLIPQKQAGKLLDPSLRYPSDHEIFIILYKFLRDGLWRTNDVHYIPMADEAINLIFHLCDKPDSFCERLIGEIHEWIVNDINPWKRKENKGGKTLMQNCEMNELLAECDGEGEDCEIEGNGLSEENNYEHEILLLTRFLSILGQVAANYVLFLEGPVLNELKQRNQMDFERKLKRFQEKKNKKNQKVHNSSKNEGVGKHEQEEDMEFNRIAADDIDAEEMKNKTENEIVTGNGYFAKFTPLILTICKNPGKYNNISLQNSALLTLAKFMMVSSVFCEENLQLLVTICEKSHSPESRKNAIIALGALQYKFPNTLEPWTSHMYGMLNDSHSEVRLTAVMVLTDLIVNEMIKVRSNISDLAMCIVDKDIEIAKTVRYFFKEYSLKGNSLFNVLPCLISNLIRPDSVLSEDEFKIIMRFILELVTKDKQAEHLIDKLFQYFESATTEKQWKELAFCMSLLNYSEKGLKKLLDNLRSVANKLYLSDVYEAFNVIVTNAKKNPQKDKTVVNEIQDLIKEWRDKCCQDKGVSFTSQKNSSVLSVCKSTRRKIGGTSSSVRAILTTGKKTLRCKREIKYDCDNEENDDDDNDAFMSDSSMKKSFKGRNCKSKRILGYENSDEDTENCEYPKKQSKKLKAKAQTKRTKGKCKYSDDSSEEEEKVERVLRSNRKRK